MKQERVILSFIMVLIGLLVAGSAFYFYQKNKQITQVSSTNTITSPTPTPNTKPTIFLTVSNPQNESVVDNKTLTISGKTNKEATVIVTTKSDDQVFKPSSQGDFSTTVTLGNDQNLITIRVFLPNGETQAAQRIVTYSTNNF